MPGRRYLPLSPSAVLLLLCVIAVLLPLTPYLPIWLTTLCACLIAWRLLHDLGRISLPGRVIRIVLILFALVGLFFSYYTLFGRTAGSAFLALLLCMKLLEMHTARDRMVVIFLACFMVVIGFLFSQSIIIGVYMLLETVLLTTALISVNHRPASYFSRQTVYKVYLQYASRMLLLAVPLTVVLFILFPRVPGPLWGIPEDVGGATTGLSDEMSPGRISQLSNNNAVAFRVKFYSDIPPQSELYWRGPVLWNFNGFAWSAPKSQFRLRLKSEFEISGPPVDYTLTLEPHQQRWLFALDLPADLPPKSRMSAELQLLSLQPINKVTRYELRSYTRYRIEPHDTPDLQRYLNVPPNIAPRTRGLVKRWQQEINDRQSWIQRALTYFRKEDFYYSRQPPLLFDDPVDEFLFQTRKGYCEHYASAFTVMMRLAGIPARVVTGYQGGEMNPFSDYMIVRQSDAHAWSEVWLSGEGWRRVDPTSVIPPHRIESSEDLFRRQTQASRERQLIELDWLGRSIRQARYAWDAVNNRWNQWIIGFNEKRQLALLSSWGMPNINWQGMIGLLFSLLAVLLLLIGFYLLRRRPATLDPATQLYQQFLHKIEKLGITKQESESALAFAQRVKSTRQDLAKEIDQITRDYNKLRYAAHPPRHLYARLEFTVKQFKPQRLR
jgi:transglutaminase-like putative cysteine protease